MKLPQRVSTPIYVTRATQRDVVVVKVVAELLNSLEQYEGWTKMSLSVEVKPNKHVTSPPHVDVCATMELK